jgi:hypothetical protein
MKAKVRHLGRPCKTRNNIGTGQPLSVLVTGFIPYVLLCTLIKLAPCSETTCNWFGLGL